ncbi:hypothetical protein VNI00_009775 [Paramarasmius palmivorus]|uniref:Transmembrane protein n=1 Tax=Paramarasmius palmivorus TaxID=297713 RepID=A0AAW0CPF0_9AGAR
MVLVDDRDPRVAFLPYDAWIFGGGKGELYETTHGTNISNATMTFRFNGKCPETNSPFPSLTIGFVGTYIEVWGTNPKLAESPVGPVTVFTIDDGTPVYYKPRILETAVQHQQMFASANLMDREHELRMVNAEANGKVWVDYLVFIPGEAEKRVLVDNSDQRVSYSPENAWFRSGIPEEYNGMSHGTNTTNAEMVFSFEGTYIEVYGTLQSGGEISVVFSVDDGSPFNYALNVAETLNQQRLFSANLADGEHELRMVNARAGSTIFLDYLAFIPSSNQGASQPSSSTSVSTASESAPNPTDDHGVSGSSRLSSSEVVGIVLACAATISAVVISILWWQRRRKLKRMVYAGLDSSPKNYGHISGGLAQSTGSTNAGPISRPPTYLSDSGWHQHANISGSTNHSGAAQVNVFNVHYPVSMSPSSPPPYFECA